ncbi:hypothetical protein [Microbacterium arabinogalactanolyticum]|uniref:hypothetical protein n=1 Tax=Microbacterium arabinogalactanolyticum TaxID=69365 RepID=UPI0025534BFC|nr:hypothetical protein [Microbacterium arabinogalactanolyticum]GLC86181.1 hypothetical protein MIAR_27660 [Microbacterium arabinogalactanolyticum]
MTDATELQLTDLDKFRIELMLNLSTSDISLNVVGVDGRRPVIAALETELLATLMHRVHAVGGYANIFVSGKSRVRQVSAVRGESALFSDVAEDMISEAPSGVVHVGTFLDYVATQEHGVMVPAILRDDRPSKLQDAREVTFA